MEESIVALLQWRGEGGNSLECGGGGDNHVRYCCREPHTDLNLNVQGGGGLHIWNVSHTLQGDIISLNILT